MNVTEPSRKSRLSIVEVQYQKSLTSKKEVEVPINKIPLKTYKRFSNIKYIELKDIVEKPQSPKHEMYPLIKKSTLSAYAK